MTMVNDGKLKNTYFPLPRNCFLWNTYLIMLTYTSQ